MKTLRVCEVSDSIKGELTVVSNHSRHPKFYTIKTDTIYRVGALLYVDFDYWNFDSNNLRFYQNESTPNLSVISYAYGT